MTANSIALVGATSAQGEAIRELFEERAVPVETLYLVASGESAGQNLPFKGRTLRVSALEGFDFSQVGVVIAAVPAAIAESIVPRVRAQGCTVIDLSGALTRPFGSCIVPRVNGERLDDTQGHPWIGVPHTAALAVAAVGSVLARFNAVTEASLTACLAASEAGRGGVEELARQAAELLNGRPLEARLFERQLAFNLLGRTGKAEDDGYTALERRLLRECEELLGERLPSLGVTALQAPLFFGDSLVFSVRGVRAWDRLALTEALADEPGLSWEEDEECPSAVTDAQGREEVLLGRVRVHPQDSQRLECWLVADNVRVPALIAVQLAELLLKQSA